MKNLKTRTLYKKELHDLGYRGHVAKVLLDRFRAIDQHTNTLDDQRRIAHMMGLVVQELHHMGVPITLRDLIHARSSLFFTDIGKTGPLHASRSQQVVLMEMYCGKELTRGAVETMDLKNFMKENFGANWEEKVEILKGLDPAIDIYLSLRSELSGSFRLFLDMHLRWGLELLEHSGVLREHINTAMSHHYLSGITPHGLIYGDKFIHSPPWGEQHYGMAELLVTLLDKYDAYRNRGSLSHRDAVAKLKKKASDKHPNTKTREVVRSTNSAENILHICAAIRTALG
jgi:hypothetical protein